MGFFMYVMFYTEFASPHADRVFCVRAILVAVVAWPPGCVWISSTILHGSCQASGVRVYGETCDARQNTTTDCAKAQQTMATMNLLLECRSRETNDAHIDIRNESQRWFSSRVINQLHIYSQGNQTHTSGND